MIACLTLNPALDVTTTTEKVAPTRKLRCGPPRFDPGGGGINVARAIRTLGGEAVAIFPAGGAVGAQLVALIDAIPLPRQAVPIGGATRESLTVDERASGLQYRFVMPGPELTAAELAACLAALETLSPRPSHVVASGSLPAGAPADFYGQVCRAAQRIGARMILDTSGPALRVPCPGLHLLKPSLRELEELAGRPLPEPDEQVAEARAIVAGGGAEIVVVSLGADGAFWVTAEADERLPAIPVEAQSAVGAGDSMVAALTLALAQGRPPAEAVRYGMAAGAAALLTPGTELCRREDVERLYRENGPHGRA